MISPNTYFIILFMFCPFGISAVAEEVLIKIDDSITQKAVNAASALCLVQTKNESMLLGNEVYMKRYFVYSGGTTDSELREREDARQCMNRVFQQLNGIQSKG